MGSILKEEEKKSILVEGKDKSILIDPTLEKITENSILVVDEKKLREDEGFRRYKEEIALRRYDTMIERARIMAKYPDLIPYFIRIIREQEEENYEPIN